MQLRLASFITAALAVSFAAQGAQGQSATFPDVAANHWAYLAVLDLANKGLVKGYPDGKFLAGKALSRFEFASVVDRVLQTIDAMALAHQEGATQAPGAPSPNSIDQSTLNEIQALKDTFGDQLKTIQTDVKKAQDDIDSLRSDVLDAKDMANKAKSAADNSFGQGSSRKFEIGGYIQGRFLATGTSNPALFPGGSAASSSGYNGNYEEGANGESFVVRRARLKVSGAITQNTKFAFQIDTSGLTSGTNQAVTVREGNIVYTPGDASSKNPSFTAGLFATQFGYVLPLSASVQTMPEKPLAFNEGSAGVFANQDYDRGIQVSYGPGQVKGSISLINGSGWGTNDTDRLVDQLYRATYTTVNKQVGVGASYYNGHISYIATPYVERRKQLLGFDAEYTSPEGPFVSAEYMSGTFEQRTWFDVPTLKLTTAEAAGNKIKGYYVSAGYTFDMHSPHPWTLAAVYDFFNRSDSGMPDSGSNWEDVNMGYGVLYNLDSATRIRLWYTNPSKVAHPAANPDPQNVGLFTGELQVKF